MNRETEIHFSGIPQVNKTRSKMVIPHDLLTSWDTGQLIPIYVDPDIMPGDSVKMKMASVIRMATPLYPIFGNIVADIMFFFVPYRLVWDHWREFWGESKNNWYQTTEYLVPMITAGKTGGGDIVQPKSLADYMGMPIIPAKTATGHSFSQLPFRAYCKIYNDWFKSEPLQQDIAFPTDDTDRAYSNSYPHTGGTVLNAGKLMDYYTSALPSPQAGPSVTMPLGSWAPVYARSNNYVDSIPGISMGELQFRPMGAGAGFTDNTNYWSGVATDTQSPRTFHAITGDNATASGLGTISQLYPANLWTDLSVATAASISSIRTAFQVQRFYEQRARTGNRYIEIIKGLWGVTSPDARLQRSEYLGGKRLPVNIQTVLQTSSTDSTSPQGNTGAYSHTADSDTMFSHSFSEHGILIGLMCCRYYHSYDQGTPKGFTRRKWTDFYNPFFAHLSEQPVYVKELYTTGNATDEDVFGYQEAWAGGYRYHPNTCTAEMRTTYAQSLDSWHLADHYTSQPSLGSSWIQEDKNNVDRTLAVTSQNQFFGDFYFRPVYTRVMPLYSVPGLIDHF